MRVGTIVPLAMALPDNVTGRVFSCLNQANQNIGAQPMKEIRIMTATCPECEAQISLDKPMRGEIVSCPDCGAELEVTSTAPLTLEPAPMTEEDYGE